ncbi:hypothetical protein [Actinotalea sp. C106]|uniref:hypothetical protein n=1 Tax=Actinotalea sp. C106 TaxID=2908644 RepID=UPI00202803C4|nr:hypothetical protein [Actinotalea sp. C106]
MRTSPNRLLGTALGIDYPLAGADHALHVANALLLVGVGLTSDHGPRAGTRPLVTAA